MVPPALVLLPSREIPISSILNTFLNCSDVKEAVSVSASSIIVAKLVLDEECPSIYKPNVQIVIGCPY